MMPATTLPADTLQPVRPPFLVLLIGWLIPGAGHLILGKRGRGALILGSVLASFAIGVMMRGPLFQPSGGNDVLSRFIQVGGFVADLASGLPYLLASWFGYAAPDIASHTADYGSKFIVAAGLLNILALVDAYEIATRQKD